MLTTAIFKYFYAHPRSDWQSQILAWIRGPAVRGLLQTAHRSSLYRYLIQRRREFAVFARSLKIS